ncbi:hypothetical protein [Paucibacter sp. Y2R2-4]|uniref:hypothetical protein n=1 Tax=Paucibacter sp. Y2R2-4 TaxID=2893553 RepID=UPI0021E3C557|nr:hypothetical protein [Paucibacter sp. Y2R2-4]MCV2348638.1 hypothetical protein [Paucibacter sp. Y2R2-4]
MKGFAATGFLGSATLFGRRPKVRMISKQYRAFTCTLGQLNALRMRFPSRIESKFQVGPGAFLIGDVAQIQWLSPVLAGKSF